MSAHKPRRRKENEEENSTLATTSNGSAIAYGLEVASFNLADLLASGRKTSQWVLLPVIVAIAVLFRWSVGIWGYSGQGVEPMHGDFEAQRHWMEITAHLPVAKWYFYDLDYWGLDYPPLTAYHSFLLGKVGSILNPSWFALEESRGYESNTLKTFMRTSVVISELYFYIPTAIVACRRFAGLNGASKWEASIAIAALLMQPATLLIDHGHFQYNTVMLGLVLGAVNAWSHDRYATGCVFFVASLAFKQMALYYAPAVFAYLLGSCVFPRLNVTRFISIALATAISFACMWAPLLAGAWYSHLQHPSLTTTLDPPPLFAALTSTLPISVSQSNRLYIPLLHLTQSIHRIFPLARGLFEDKVANIWLAVHTVYKLNQFSVSTLSRVSLLATIGAVLPSCVIIFLRPRKSLLPLALASSAWSFFLLSFQVHEKSALLPLLPMTLLLASEPNSLGPETRAWVSWANVLGSWTMFPLLKRDGQAVPYAAITLLWTILLDVPPLRWELYRIDKNGPRQASALTLPIHVTTYVLMALWHGCEAYIDPPLRKPDLWVVINCLVGVIGFVVCWLWCNSMLLYRSGLLDGLLKGRDGEQHGADKNLTKKIKDSTAAVGSGRKSSKTPQGTTKRK